MPNAAKSAAVGRFGQVVGLLRSDELRHKDAATRYINGLLSIPLRKSSRINHWKLQDDGSFAEMGSFFRIGGTRTP
jgi:hypothetical protein